MCISKAAWRILSQHSVCHYLKSYLLSRTLTKEQSLSALAAVLFLCNFGREGGNFERKCTLGGGEGALETRENSFILMRFYSKYTFSQRSNSLRYVFFVSLFIFFKLFARKMRESSAVCISFPFWSWLFNNAPAEEIFY